MAMKPFIAVITATVDGEGETKNTFNGTIVSIGNNNTVTNTCRSLHHEAVDVGFPADAVERCILALHGASVRPRQRLGVGHVTILKEPAGGVSDGPLVLHLACQAGSY